MKSKKNLVIHAVVSGESKQWVHHFGARVGWSARVAFAKWGVKLMRMEFPGCSHVRVDMGVSL